MELFRILILQFRYSFLPILLVVSKICSFEILQPWSLCLSSFEILQPWSLCLVFSLLFCLLKMFHIFFEMGVVPVRRFKAAAKRIQVRFRWIFFFLIIFYFFFFLSNFAWNCLLCWCCIYTKNCCRIILCASHFSNNFFPFHQHIAKYFC